MAYAHCQEVAEDREPLEAIWRVNIDNSVSDLANLMYKLFN
jgi:hypothetical protein